MRPAPVEMGCGNIKNAGRVDRKSLLNHDIDVLPRDRLHPGAGLKSDNRNGSKSCVWKLRIHFLRCLENVQGSLPRGSKVVESLRDEFWRHWIDVPGEHRVLRLA